MLTQKGVPLPRQRATLVYIDSLDGDFDGYPDTGPESNAEANNLAYVIYTSGSTGRPKGVAIEHRSAVALLCWAADTFAPEQWAGTLASTSICFDLSVFELFVRLERGRRGHSRYERLGTTESRVRVPGHAGQHSAFGRRGTLEDRRHISASAAQRSIWPASLCKPTLVRQLYDRGIDRVYDLYGPTETRLLDLCLAKQPGPATIGHPIANTQVYILDPHLNPVRIGVPGESHIGGAGLARGYLDRDRPLDGEEFIADPFRDDPVRVCTRPAISRYLADGNIEFLGRLDDQVEYRGFASSWAKSIQC